MITQAIKIRAAIVGPDVFLFFKQLKRTSYMFACLMLIFLKTKYMAGIEAIKKGLGPQSWPFDLVASQLQLSEDDAKSLVVACGFGQNDKR